ncbi:MAG TPA: single-stranded-DNA-specific exonuclease RecJ [Candidatus Latescibacteria bacterium]|nr:single-stranded-DNA-specific exonuclease RecJ [Candidatus Latescibacterota bacterium]HRS95007.1 single-stranded-DNA-specific exonuclease RecJ [Candidatus Latescibacterota bacterium]
MSGSRDPTWVFPPPCAEEEVRSVATRWDIPLTVAEILLRRVNNPDSPAARDDAIARFLNPSFRHLHDPYLYNGMHRAVERICRAVVNREQVSVYGDYDVDGTTATALMVEALQTLGVPVEWRIPHRTADGYGLSDRGVELLRDTAGTLVIVLDCGVTAVEQIATLTREGRDVIVVDHHEEGETLPNALAVLDAKCARCTYPFPGLSAVGVAFKLLQAVCDALRVPPGRILIPGLDLVAVGTAADIVPVIDENRVLMRFGLRRLRKSPRPGLRALLQVAGLAGKELTTSSIVFGLAPRINAAGRMGSAETSVRLLLTQDEDEARSLARELNQLNRDRQGRDQDVFDSAHRQAEEQVAQGARALVLADERWHPGIIGIVAARLVEEFYLPTVMITGSTPFARGSGRSIDGFDLHAALGACANTLIGYGGHIKAAGLSIDPQRIPEFRQCLQQVAAERLTDDLLSPRLYLDGEARLSDITPEYLKAVARLGPFGPDNMQPVLVSRHVRAISDPVIMKDAHLKVEVEQEGVTREIIGYGFKWAAPLFYDAANRSVSAVDIAYVPEENVWRGKSKTQLRLKAVRRSDEHGRS